VRHADQQSKNSNKVSPTKSAQDSEEPTEVEDPNGEMEVQGRDSRSGGS